MPMSLDPQPIPVIPKTSKKLKLLEFDSLEVARQLTMIECQLYMKIRPSECLMRSREQRSENHDSIAAIIVTTNKVESQHDILYPHLNLPHFRSPIGWPTLYSVKRIRENGRTL